MNEPAPKQNNLRPAASDALTVAPDPQTLAPRLLAAVRSVADELRSQARLAATLGLDHSLERDYGLDSLARVELLARIECELGLSLAEAALTEAETPRDLLRFIVAFRGHDADSAPAVAARSTDSGAPPAPILLRVRRAVLTGLLGALLLAGFVVLRPFLAAIAWAAILTYVSWPLHLRVLARLHGHRNWAALAMTAVLTLVLGGALLWLGLLLRSRAAAALREAATLLQSGVRLPEPIARVPWFGPWLQERLLEQLRRILHSLLGDRVQGYFAAVGDTTRAVVYGGSCWQPSPKACWRAWATGWRACNRPFFGA